VFPAEGAGLFHEHSDVRTRHFHHSYLRANKVSKSGQTRKVEHAYHSFESVLMLFTKNYQN